VTRFGKFSDPVADKLLTTAIFVMLAARGAIPGWVVVVILSREFAFETMSSDCFCCMNDLPSPAVIESNIQDETIISLGCIVDFLYSTVSLSDKSCVVTHRTMETSTNQQQVRLWVIEQGNSESKAVDENESLTEKQKEFERHRINQMVDEVIRRLGL